MGAHPFKDNGLQGFLRGRLRWQVFHGSWYFAGWTHVLYLSSCASAAWAQFNVPMGVLEDGGGLLDAHHGIAFGGDGIKHVQQLMDVRVMQANAGLDHDVEGITGVGLLKLVGDFDALGFSPRQGRGGLAKGEVSQPQLLQHAQPLEHLRVVCKEVKRLVHRELVDVRDGLAFKPDLQGLVVEALAAARIAHQVHLAQKVHAQLGFTRALAGFAPAAFVVEREARLGEFSGLGLFGTRQQIPNGIRQAQVGGRIASWGFADGRVVDEDQLVNGLHPPVTGQSQWGLKGLSQMLLHRRHQGLQHQAGLARTGTAADHIEPAELEGHIDVLEVVLGAAQKLQLAFGVRQGVGGRRGCRHSQRPVGGTAVL